MDISLKTSRQIQIMKQGGQKLSSILTQLFYLAKAGVNLLKIEEKAIQLIKLSGGQPAFARVPNYHWATCLNVNDGIVHGVPKDYILKSGDVLNIDIGLFYQGFNTDMSATVQIQNKSCKPMDKKYDEVENFLLTGERALGEAIKQAKPGNRVGHISQKIQQIIEGAGYNCSRNLTGHGVGLKLHEPPSIPCLLVKPVSETPLLQSGMTLAIEVIYVQGNPDLMTDQKDKWTVRTKDGKIAAVFEQTIALKRDGCLILTKLPFPPK